MIFLYGRERKKWTLGVSIPLPPACEAGALPSELNALNNDKTHTCNHNHKQHHYDTRHTTHDTHPTRNGCTTHITEYQTPNTRHSQPPQKLPSLLSHRPPWSPRATTTSASCSCNQCNGTAAYTTHIHADLNRVESGASGCSKLSVLTSSTSGPKQIRLHHQ